MKMLTTLEDGQVSPSVQSMKKGRGTGDYKLHILPTGASPVPLVYGERKVAAWEFYCKGWHGVREVRYGATSYNLFPEARKGSLDGDLLSKMGLTTARMIEGEALFFVNGYYQFAILNVREYRGVIDNHFAVKLKD